MSWCFDCAKTNKDESLRLITEEAKKVAIESGEPKAIYKDGSEYKYISAWAAARERIPIVSIVSSYH